MREMIYFESVRFWGAKKTIVVFFVFLIALLSMGAYNMFQDNTFWRKQVAIIKSESTLISNEIKDLEAQLKSVRDRASDDTETIEALEKQLQFFRTQHLYNYEQGLMAKHYSKDNATARLELWIQRDQHLLAGMDAGLSFLDQTEVEVRQRLSVNQYLVQENITPLNSPYEMTSTNFIYKLTDYPWMLIILFTLTILLIDMFSGDIEGGAYKILYSQPFTRSKIYFMKYLVHSANSVIVITGLIMIVFGIAAIFNGIGNINYPTFYFSGSYDGLVTATASESVLATLPWSTYIIRLLPLYCLEVCFIITAIGTASLLLNNTANALSVIISLLFLDFGFRTLISGENILFSLWPLTASALNNVLQGSYYFSAAAYLVLLGSLTVLLLVTGLVILNKRNLTGGTG